METKTTIFTKELDGKIRNVLNLPACKGAKYLRCIHGPGDELVAKSWHRKLPTTLSVGEVLIEFK